ncbi:exported hypothetical protein [uncultured Mycobacterium sp.]|uniref:Pyrroline-5-carboxylate reductase catalytic N-terminal domain-containing protein n=1 Tax=uncultured Mycobacterium sp. TaxID=171292 RepID=A0A1Y5NXJ9_9MYCO|nr:exported hypothetical protein [uncultured Mycobacterium sp.]
MSSISIIGVGSMASALAGRALAGGNAVEIIGRDAAKAKALAAALGGAAVGNVGTAPAGDIVILAVPYASAAAVISEGDRQGRPRRRSSRAWECTRWTPSRWQWRGRWRTPPCCIWASSPTPSSTPTSPSAFSPECPTP